MASHIFDKSKTVKMFFTYISIKIKKSTLHNLEKLLLLSQLIDRSIVTREKLTLRKA